MGVDPAAQVSHRGLAEPLLDVGKSDGSPIPAVDADFQARAGAGQAAVGMAVEVEMATMHARPDTMRIVR